MAMSRGLEMPARVATRRAAIPSGAPLGKVMRQTAESPELAEKMASGPEVHQREMGRLRPLP